MAVGGDLLQLDLYGLLGVGEKASEKEVRAAAARGHGEARARASFRCPPDRSWGCAQRGSRF